MNEINEHQPIEHERGVPLKIGVLLFFAVDLPRTRKTIDKFEKGGMFCLEAVVKPLGDFVHIEGGAGASRHIHHRDYFLFFHIHSYLIKPLGQEITRLADVKTMVATSQGFSRFTANPLPDLLPGSFVGINDKMLAGGFGNLMVNLEACGAVRNMAVTNEGDKSPFLGNGAKGNRLAIDRDVQLRVMIVPAKMLAKERFEIK